MKYNFCHMITATPLTTFIRPLKYSMRYWIFWVELVCTLLFPRGVEYYKSNKPIVRLEVWIVASTCYNQRPSASIRSNCFYQTWCAVDGNGIFKKKNGLHFYGINRFSWNWCGTSGLQNGQFWLFPCPTKWKCSLKYVFPLNHSIIKKTWRCWWPSN